LGGGKKQEEGKFSHLNMGGRKRMEIHASMGAGGVLKEKGLRKVWSKWQGKSAIAAQEGKAWILGGPTLEKCGGKASNKREEKMGVGTLLFMKLESGEFCRGRGKVSLFTVHENR